MSDFIDPTFGYSLIKSQVLGLLKSILLINAVDSDETESDLLNKCHNMNLIIQNTHYNKIVFYGKAGSVKLILNNKYHENQKIKKIKDNVFLIYLKGCLIIFNITYNPTKHTQELYIYENNNNRHLFQFNYRNNYIEYSIIKLLK